MHVTDALTLLVWLAVTLLGVAVLVANIVADVAEWRRDEH
jgi:hypothetical protein